jgi:hypothetical protein
MSPDGAIAIGDGAGVAVWDVASGAKRFVVRA